MEAIKPILMYVVLAFILLVTVAGPRAAEAADLFTLTTENGLEFYLVEGTIDPVSFDAIFSNQSGLALTLDGLLTDGSWDPQRMFASAPSSTADRSPAGFPGFRTSFLGRVLAIDAQFAGLLGQPTIRVAHQSRTKGVQLRALPPASSRLVWQAREGLTILSF